MWLSDVAPFAENHFNCFRLLRRSVILYGTGKATAPIEGRDVRPSGESPQLAALLTNGFAREAESNERSDEGNGLGLRSWGAMAKATARRCKRDMAWRGDGS